MTNRDRDSVAKLLRQVAERLAAAPTETWERADAHAKVHGHASKAPYQAGALEQICRSEAAAIESLIIGYLSPAKPRARGKR